MMHELASDYAGLAILKGANRDFCVIKCWLFVQPYELKRHRSLEKSIESCHFVLNMQARP